MFCPYCKSEYKDETSKCPHCDTPLIKSPSPLETKEPDHPIQYLNDLEDWYNNQYNPGYWMGGRHTPPHIKMLSQRLDSKSKRIIALIAVVLIIVFITVSLLQLFSTPHPVTIINSFH